MHANKNTRVIWALKRDTKKTPTYKVQKN